MILIQQIIMESFTFTPETKEREDFETIKRESINFLFSFEKPEFYIDKGGVGTVYDIGNRFCIKILDERHTSPNRHLFDLGNTPDVEAAFQEKMSHAVYEGNTRSPKMFGTISSQIEGERNALIMERLDAVNMQHIINETVPIPEGFDLDTYFEDLEKYLQNMHERYQIAHNDLYARNIMIDQETATARMIDFGRSVDLTKLSSDSEKQKFIDFDWQNLEDAYLQLETALQKSE